MFRRTLKLKMAVGLCPVKLTADLIFLTGHSPTFSFPFKCPSEHLNERGNG